MITNGFLVSTNHPKRPNKCYQKSANKMSPDSNWISPFVNLYIMIADDKPSLLIFRILDVVNNPIFTCQTFENFEFLKVLGKGTFGKVSYFVFEKVKVTTCNSFQTWMTIMIRQLAYMH